MIERNMGAGFAWAALDRVGSALMGFVIYALLARILTPGDMGAYFLAFSIVSFGLLVGTMGLNQAAVRFVAESMGLGQTGRARRVIGLVSRYAVGGSVLAGGLYLFLGKYISTEIFGSPTLASATVLVALWMSIITLQRILPEIFRGFHDLRLASIFNGLFTGSLLVIAFGTIYLTYRHAELNLVLTITLCATLASAMVGGVVLYRRVSALSNTDNEIIGSSQLMHVAIPILISNLSEFVVNQAPVWIAGAFLPTEQVALYGAAARLVLLMAMPLVIVNAVVMPVIAEMYAQKKTKDLERILRSATTIIGIPVLLIMLAFVIFGKSVLGVVFGDFYKQSAGVLAILCMGQAVNVLAGSSGALLKLTGHHAQAMKITVLGALVSIAAAIMGARSYGIMGIAVASALGMVVWNCGMVLYEIRVLHIKSYFCLNPKSILWLSKLNAQNEDF